jgi:hypothetical protein
MNEKERLQKLKQTEALSGWPKLMMSGVIALGLAWVFMVGAAERGAAEVEIVLTATPTAAPQQAAVPAGPTQSVTLQGDAGLVGRVGFVYHNGAEWVHEPWCTAVLTCRWPMQPPNETYKIWVEYGSRSFYMAADPLAPVVPAPLFLVGETP